MIIPFIEQEATYTAGFQQQGGFNLPRYRGSPMIGGNFWGRVLGFAKGLFSRVAPHISSLITQAQPHVKRVANQAIVSAVDKAVEHVTERLKQSGTGKRTVKRSKKPRLKNSNL